MPDSSNEDATGTVVDDFLTHLERNGRSSYTLRSYRQGLGHFARWLAETGLSLDAVRRVDIDEYVDAFRVGEKAGACRVDSARAGQVNPLTRKPYPAKGRQQATVNHRLSVLSSFFSFVIERDNELGEGEWCGRRSPVPSPPDPMVGSHGMEGRDVIRRSSRAELRQRVPRRRPRDIDPALARDLIDVAVSARDKAILTLLWRSRQRIGDWDDVHGRHGVLGMALTDLDERTSTISVRLKGARDEHRVPVTDDFWPLFHRYLADERGGLPVSGPAWVGLRRGRGRPLSYPAFEASLRYASMKLGANVNAHMFRHTLAQSVVETAGLKVAQEILGHLHVSTTADIYAHTDQRAMLSAMVAARDLFELSDSVDCPASLPVQESEPATRFVFQYDPATIEELDQAAGGAT